MEGDYRARADALSQGLVGQRLLPRPGWDEYFMAIAKVVSTRSTCSSRPVGCVIVRENRILVSGYNGAPPGQPHCTDQSRDGALYCARRAKNVPDLLKQEACKSLHAEQNALDLAVRLGLEDRLAGSSVYVTLAPCLRCIKAMAEKGVERVYYELAYQSVDAERDAQWQKAAEEAFGLYRQLSLSPPSSQKISGAILGVTSTRLLPSG
jgi:dCMP deaminase